MSQNNPNPLLSVLGLGLTVLSIAIGLTKLNIALQIESEDDKPAFTMPTVPWKTIVPVGMGVVAVGAVVLVVREQRPRHRYRVNLPSYKGIRTRPVNLPVKPQRPAVSAATEQRLLALVGGDYATVMRLVNSIGDRYPDQSEQWCWEKAIYDLERDRLRG